MVAQQPTSVSPAPPPRCPTIACRHPYPLPSLTTPDNRPKPLPRRPSKQGGAGTQLLVTTETENSLETEAVRSSLPVPLARSPFASPVRANSIPHAPKVPPRNAPKVPSLPQHRRNAHNQQAKTPRKQPSNPPPQHANTRPFLTQLAADTNTHKRLLPHKEPNTETTQVTCLSEEMIQLISEREREMFDYHAAQPSTGIVTSNAAKQRRAGKPNSSTEVKTLQQQQTTVCQIYCQRCQRVLKKGISDSRESLSPTRTSCCPCLSGQFYPSFRRFRRYIRKKLRRRPHWRNITTEHSLASSFHQFCDCEKSET